MKRVRARLLLAFLLLITGACGQPQHEAADSSHAEGVRGSDSAGAVPVTNGDAASFGGHATDAHAAGEGGEALLPIMQRLGSDMTALTVALLTDDYETVTQRSAAIAEHAPISAAEFERIHGELGSEMAAFKAVDESVHVASVRLHEAARAREPARIVERLADVQRGCVSCHMQFRERLRTNRSLQ